MPELQLWTYRLNDTQAERLSNATSKLLDTITEIALEVNPPDVEIYRAVIYEITLEAISVISEYLPTAIDQSIREVVKKLGLEPDS